MNCQATIDDAASLFNGEGFQCFSRDEYPFSQFNFRASDFGDQEEGLLNGELPSGESGDYSMENHSPGYISVSPSREFLLRSVLDSVKMNDGTQSCCNSPQVRQVSGTDDTSAQETASASEAEPSLRNYENTIQLGISVDEPHKKRYKSKDSEKNRRNRINEKLQELKNLIPVEETRNLTKEEILIEAIHYIHNLHSQIDRKAKVGKEAEVPTPPTSKKSNGKVKPQKRARLYIFMLFVFGIGLLAFPFINPPQSHPLFQENYLPRHHSRILAEAGLDSNSCTTRVSNEWSAPFLRDTEPENLYHSSTEGELCEMNEDCEPWQNCEHGHCVSDHLHGRRCSSNMECMSHYQSKTNRKRNCKKCTNGERIALKKSKPKLPQYSLLCELAGICSTHSIVDFLNVVYNES